MKTDRTKFLTLAILCFCLSACHTVEKGSNTESKVSDSEIPLVPYDGWKSMTQEQKWSMQLVVSVILSEARAEGKEGMTAVMNVINRRAGGNPVLFAQVVAEYKQFRCMDQFSVSSKDMARYNALVAKPYDLATISDEDSELIIKVDSWSADIQYFLITCGEYKQWDVAAGIVIKAYTGQLEDITGGATHYHPVGKKPDWADDGKKTVQVGELVFYKL